MSPTDEDEIVEFPVPRRYLPAVVQALASAMNQVEPAPPEPFDFAASAASGGRNLPHRTWTATELGALRQAVSDRPAPRAMLELTAGDPGKNVSFETIYEKAGVSRASARAAFAGFTQLVRRQFGRSNWPVDWAWGVNGDSQAYYRMPEEIAEIWRKL